LLARTEPARNRHADSTADDADRPYPRVPVERDLERSIGKHVADDRRSRCREHPGQPANGQELGDLRGRKLALARPERSQYRRVVATLVLGHGDRGLEHENACEQREQEHEFDRARDLFDDRLNLMQDLTDVDYQDVGK
jgi:hypothetical protein